MRSPLAPTKRPGVYVSWSVNPRSAWSSWSSWSSSPYRIRKCALCRGNIQSVLVSYAKIGREGNHILREPSPRQQPSRCRAPTSLGDEAFGACSLGLEGQQRVLDLLRRDSALLEIQADRAIAVATLGELSRSRAGKAPVVENPGARE